MSDRSDAAEDDGADAGLSRRELLMGGGGVLAGAAVATGVTLAVTDGDGNGADGNGVDGEVPGDEQEALRLTSLTVEQAETLDAIVARLVPSGDDGLGAREAGVVAFIDRALFSDFRDQLPVYESNLVAIDERAAVAHGSRFRELGTDQQDELLRTLEEESPPSDGNQGSIEAPPSFSGGFFDTLIEHTRMGMFGDPAYGGNRDFVGWRLMGYDGVRMSVSEEAQQLDAGIQGDPRSAYSFSSVGLSIGNGDGGGS